MSLNACLFCCANTHRYAWVRCTANHRQSHAYSNGNAISDFQTCSQYDEHVSAGGAPRGRSRLSIGAKALGTPPDPGMGYRALHHAPPTPPIPTPPPPSARVGPQPAALPQNSEGNAVVSHRGLTAPYTQRLQSPGTV